MNILVIEGKLIVAEGIQELVLKAIPGAHVLGLCDSIKASVRFLQTQKMPDLIPMDIEQADGQSFAIFQEVEVNRPVIFTRTYDERTKQLLCPP